MNLDKLNILRGAFAAALTPPPWLNLAEWSRQHVRLSQEDSSVRGEFIPWPFQQEPLEVMSPGHPAEKVCLMCASQTIKTRVSLNLLAYIMAVDPGPTLFVEPTQADAENLSKDRVDPMLRDMPVLRERVVEAKSRDAGNTIFHKKFAGGHVTFAFATTPTQLAMRPIRYLLLDEVSRYGVSAGKEGDPVRLAEKRTITFWNRKIIYASSPGNEGACRITDIWNHSDQRQWFVPCPFCGHEQTLEWSGMTWSKGAEPVTCARKTETGEFVKDLAVVSHEDPKYRCSSCDCLIGHEHKYWMNRNGRYIAQRPKGKYPGFRVNQLVSPVRSWADIVSEWMEVWDKPEQRKVFHNTVLAETYRTMGEEPPDDEKLWLRAQMNFKPDVLPSRIHFVTAGIDVQGDRLEVQVRGWNGRTKESWLIDYEVIPGKPQNAEAWAALDSMLDREYPHAGGARLPISVVAIDSGDATQEVYSWARRKRPDQVLVVKGSATGIALLGQPSPVDVMVNGKKMRRGCKVRLVNVSMAKSEVYGWLKHEAPKEGEPFPNGYLHDYAHSREYFAQFCAESFQYRIVKGFRRGEWVKNRERNEVLDTFVYARAAAEHYGLSRRSEQHWRAIEKYLGVEHVPVSTVEHVPIPADLPVPIPAPVAARQPAPAVHQAARRQPRFRFKARI